MIVQSVKERKRRDTLKEKECWDNFGQRDEPVGKIHLTSLSV